MNLTTMNYLLILCLFAVGCSVSRHEHPSSAINVIRVLNEDQEPITNAYILLDRDEEVISGRYNADKDGIIRFVRTPQDGVTPPIRTTNYAR